MILALDVGNTNTVIGAVDSSHVFFTERIRTDTHTTKLEFASLIRCALEINGILPDDIDGAVMSSVVPGVNTNLCRAVESTAGCTPVIIKHDIDTGLDIQTDTPSELGCDLIAGAAGALGISRPPLIILDMGTATTFSVVTEPNIYKGTVIVPGLLLAQEALTKGTAQLPSVTVTKPPHVIGTNTRDCMLSGMIYSSASMIDGMIDRINDELGTQATTIATGGLAELVIKYCKHDIVYDGELLLKGAYGIYKKNSARSKLTED